LSNDPLVEAVREWAAKEKAHNPSFSFVVGRKAFSAEEIVEHIENGTEEGKMLRKMIFKTATSLFYDYKPK